MSVAASILAPDGGAGGGQLIAVQPTPGPKPLDAGVDGLRGVSARRGVLAQRITDPQLGEDVHLDGIEPRPDARGQMTVAAVLADQVGGPPQTPVRRLRALYLT